MLLTMGNAERTEPLLLLGPKGLTKVVGALLVIAPELPFPIQYAEISEVEQAFEVGGLRIEAFRVHHNVLCYGYSLSLIHISTTSFQTFATGKSALSFRGSI